MKGILPTILFILSSVSILAAQESKTPCPQIEIIGPPVVVTPGETMIFSVSLKEDAAKSGLKYEWQIDEGEIIAGQETNQITVSTDGLEDTTVNATVEIEGLPGNCKSFYAESGVVAQMSGCTRPLEEFEDIPDNDVRERLDGFFIGLMNDPDITGYIVQYGPAKDVVKRENLIREHAELRELNAGRLIILYKDHEPKIRTTLWLVPFGADISEID